MPLDPGTKLGRYEVRTPLGAGGMGEVYLAWDTELDRQVALKVLPQEVAWDRQRTSRFVQEARAASALDHPNILSVHDIGEADSVRFIVMEYLEGETLRQRMSAGQMSPHEALDVAAQAASALAEAHVAGIVHRDVKPENLMLRRGGIVKVLDFGIAKLTQRRPEEADTEAPTMALVNTGPGTVMGTVSYMSPEQARGLEVDGRTDVWSLGVVLYEMVSGRLPFEGETPTDVLATILHREPRSLQAGRADVPDELERIVEKALAKDREERYQTAKDLAVDLRRLRHRLDVEADLERSVTPERGVKEKQAATVGGEAGATSNLRPAKTGGGDEPRTTSSVEYVLSEVKRHRTGALIALAAPVLLVAAVAYFAYSRYSARASGESIGSVAVLPFQNFGGNPETEYLSDGISESVINSLSQLPQLKVVARSSSFKFKGKDADLQAVARALGVQAVVTGRVVLLGDRLRVSAEMVEAGSDRQLWGEQYTRKASDLLSVQSDISREIAGRLRVRLTSNEQQRLAGRETQNPQAYELLLRGRFHGNKSGTENRKKAIEYYRQAVAADPNYARAHAHLSDSYRMLVNATVADPKEYVPKAWEEARRALALDEGLAEAHSALASLHRDAWEWADAEREYRRAIELNPSLARAHGAYASYLSVVGRHDEAVAEARRATQLSPLDLPPKVNLGAQLYHARRHDEAIEVIKETLEIEPGMDGVYTLLGYVYAAKGMYREAIAQYEEAIRRGDHSTGVQVYLGAAYALAGERERARAILKRLEGGKEYVSPGELPVLYVALGERERALDTLKRAYGEHDLQLQYLNVEPGFDPLRSDPRFQELVRKVGLPQ